MGLFKKVWGDKERNQSKNSATPKNQKKRKKRQLPSLRTGPVIQYMSNEIVHVNFGRSNVLFRDIVDAKDPITRRAKRIHKNNFSEKKTDFYKKSGELDF